ncbi:unnamed protein product [Dimorphilus gyrociliatus]|uniref:Uncharacterized protein n=1 Tax=Dimorphilus gyrociliatus TaxID=2664684 RepID=A0A7I8VDN1_9ANNE|nr:unnamed protein product [Dimorphilus gyrociliatus]
MPESQLPPVKVQRVRRKRLDTNVRISSSKERSKYNKPLRKDGLRVPRSLFDRPQSMRRDQRLFKPLSPTKIGRSSSSDNLTGERPDWAIYEDWFILYYINAIENKDNFSSAPTLPNSSINWDFVSDGVNGTSRSYRTAKHCVARYDSKVLPREEGRPTFDSTPAVGRKSMKKSIKTLTGRKSGRSLRTSQLILQDQNKSLTQYFNNRIELILTLSKKRSPPPRPALANPTQKNPKHQMVLVENGITYDNPLSPVQVAKRRADRINKDKPKQTTASSTPATPTTTKSIVSTNVNTSRVASFPTQTNTTTAIQYVQASVSTSSTSVVVPATVTLARTVTATPPTTNVMINTTIKKGTQPNQRSVNFPGVVQAQRQTLSTNQQSAAILKINAGIPRVPISKGQQKVRLPQAQANVLASLQKQPALAVVQTGQSKNTIPNATVQRPELTLYMHKAKSTSVPKFSGQKSVASSQIFAHIQHASQSLVSNQTTASIASTTVAQLVKASGNPSTVGRTGVQSVQKIQVVPQGTKKATGGQPIVIQRPINVQALLKQPQSTAASTSTGTIHQLIPQSSTSSSVTLTLPVSQTSSLQTKQHSIMAIRSGPPRSGNITAQGRITPTVHKSIQLQLHSTASSSLQRRQQPTPSNLATVAFLPQSASGSSSTVSSTLVTVTAPKQTPSKKS